MKLSIILITLLLVSISIPLWADEIGDNLISAIIQVESHGNPNAVSPKGAIGLMQITPIVLKEYNENRKDRSVFYNIEECQLGDPELNKIIGTWYLHRLKNHYLKDKYTIERLLAAYNGGITRLRKNNYDINKMPSETRAYIKKVLKIYKANQAQKD